MLGSLLIWQLRVVLIHLVSTLYCFTRVNPKLTFIKCRSCITLTFFSTAITVLFPSSYKRNGYEISLMLEIAE